MSLYTLSMPALHILSLALAAACLAGVNLYLTAFLGGTVATHVRVGSPLATHVLFGVYVAAFVWAGLALRSPSLLALLMGGR